MNLKSETVLAYPHIPAPLIPKAGIPAKVKLLRQRVFPVGKLDLHLDSLIWKISEPIFGAGDCIESY
jgi:hypothetical protein